MEQWNIRWDLGQGEGHFSPVLLVVPDVRMLIFKKKIKIKIPEMQEKLI